MREVSTEMMRHRIWSVLLLYPWLVLSACAGPSLIEPPPTPALRTHTVNHETLVQKLSNLQTTFDKQKTALEKLPDGLRAALQLELEAQRRDSALLARAEAQTPPSMDVALTHEWEATLTTLRHEVDDRRARSTKLEEQAQQLIAETEELARQYGTLRAQVGEANAQLNAVPPSDALWLERRDVITSTTRQLSDRRREFDKQLKGLHDHYRLRMTDWEQTRSDAVVTARVTELEGIIGRAKKFAAEQERQHVLPREQAEAQQRRNAASQARIERDAQPQQAEAAAKASSPECASYGVDGTALSGSAVEHVNRGVQLEARGQLKEAITEYCLAVRIAPDYQTARTKLLFALRLAAHDSDALRRRTELMGHAKRDREALESVNAIQAEKERPFKELLHRHKAVDMSSLNDSYKLYVNPFAYQGKRVFLSGGYHKNIGRHEALVAILPDQNPTKYIVVWHTSRNLADGSPFLRCVVKVLGTTSVLQGMMEREVPHVQEIACLPS